MRIGPMNNGLFVRCTPLGTDREAWHAPSDRCSVVRVGTADESGTTFFSFLLYNRDCDESVMEVRAASSLTSAPLILVESDHLFVITDGWIAEVNIVSKCAAWEYLNIAPILDAWLVGNGRLVVVAEIDVFALELDGRPVWREEISAIVAEYRRCEPKIYITCDDGTRLVIDEVTGLRTADG